MTAKEYNKEGGEEGENYPRFHHLSLMVHSLLSLVIDGSHELWTSHLFVGGGRKEGKIALYSLLCIARPPSSPSPQTVEVPITHPYTPRPIISLPPCSKSHRLLFESRKEGGNPGSRFPHSLFLRGGGGRGAKEGRRHMQSDPRGRKKKGIFRSSGIFCECNT